MSRHHLLHLRNAALIALLASTLACEPRGDRGDALELPPDDMDQEQIDGDDADPDALDPEDVPEEVLTPDETGCPSDTGYTVTGVVRLATLHPTPQVSGPTLITKFPCGRESTDPTKNTCGTGQILVLLCSSADCTAPGDPIRRHVNPAGQLLQSSFDKEAFAFCGLDAGTYHILPIIDHDASGALSSFDWTMGIKNLANPAVSYPARVEGHRIELEGDLDLGTSLVPTNPQVSPVVINFFHYQHAAPRLQPEDYWLFVAATLNPEVADKAVGMRAVDLDGWLERDHNPDSPAVDAQSLAGLNGMRYEGDLEKLLYHDHTAFLGTNQQGVILTVSFSADGSIQQGHFIDLSGLEVDHKLDVSHSAAIVETSGKRFLAVTNRESASKPLPHQPAFPLWIVDITELSTENATAAQLYDAARMPELHNVRFDQIMAHAGMLFAVESGANSRARSNDGLTRLWVMQLDDTGAIAQHHIYDIGLFKSGTFEECSTTPPYRQAGLWVGDFNGSTHAFIGGLRTMAILRFSPDQVDSGLRLQLGTGLDSYDLPLDAYALGFSILRVSPDGSKLFAFGDCKSRYLAVREGDWAGNEGLRTQSRRRTAVLDLSSAGPEGLPPFYLGYADRINVPDTVRTSLSGANEVLSEEHVVGIGTDCRGILWDLYDTFGYQHIQGATFGSDCLANRVADAVVTDHHIYLIGEGSVANRTTGLGVSSEVLVLDLATGQEVIHPEWQWVYDGSAYQSRYGYFGQTLGERKDLETSKGLFLVPR